MMYPWQIASLSNHFAHAGLSGHANLCCSSLVESNLMTVWAATKIGARKLSKVWTKRQPATSQKILGQLYKTQFIRVFPQKT